MNVRQLNNYDSDISEGLIEDKSFWYKFGESEIDTVITTLWSGTSLQGGLYVYPDYANEGVAVKMRCKTTSALDIGKTIIIQGLDSNWKLQSETIILNGTTYVETEYEYLRIFRASMLYGSLEGVFTAEELSGGSDYIYCHIEDSGLEVNQTQMGFYSVPAGYTLDIKKITCTKADSQPIKIYASIREIGEYGYDDGNGNITPFRTQLNWNASYGGFDDETPHPFVFAGMTDIEIRGIATSNKTSDVAVNLFGHLTRVSSVPITPTGVTATPGDTTVTISWDTLKPSDLSDCKGFELSDGTKTVLKECSDIEYTFDNLVNGQEYTFTICFVGYDNKKSSLVSVTSTPTA